MNRKQIEELVGEFPPKAVEHWQKKYLKNGITLHVLKRDAMVAERKRRIYGVLSTIIITGMSASIATAAIYVGTLMPSVHMDSTNGGLNVLAMILIVFCGASAISMSMRPFIMARLRKSSVVELYEDALRQFESSAIKLVCLLEVQKDWLTEDNLTPYALFVQGTSLAMRVIDCCRIFKERRLDTEEYGPTDVVNAGQDYIEAQDMFDTFCGGMRDFQNFDSHDRDDIYTQAKKQIAERVL